MDADRVTQFSDLALRYIGNKVGDTKGLGLLLNGAGEHMWERHRDLMDHLKFAVSGAAARPGLEKSFVDYLKAVETKNPGSLKKLDDTQNEDEKVGAVNVFSYSYRLEIVGSGSMAGYTDTRFFPTSLGLSLLSSNMIPLYIYICLQVRAVREQNKLYLEEKFSKYDNMLANIENKPTCLSCAPLLFSDSVWKAGLEELQSIDLDKGKPGHAIALLMDSLRKDSFPRLPAFDLKKRVSWTMIATICEIA